MRYLAVCLLGFAAARLATAASEPPAAPWPALALHARSAADDQTSHALAILWICAQRSAAEAQWVVVLNESSRAGAEASRPPISDVVRFTTTGRRLTYHSDPEALVQVSGWGQMASPSAACLPLPVSEVRIDRRQLGAGLDEPSRKWIDLRKRWDALRRSGVVTPGARFELASGVRPFDPLLTATMAPEARQLEISAEDEQRLFAVEPTLEAIAELATDSQAGGEVLTFLGVRPTFWSLISHLGVAQDVQVAPGGIESLGAGRYRWPFEWRQNGRNALQGRLIVGSPDGGRWVCAGIRELSAQSDEGVSRHLFIRLLSPSL